MSFKTFFCFLILCSCTPNSRKQGDASSEKIAFLGDSITLGAAAHPGLALDPDFLTKLMRGEVSLQSEMDSRFEKYFKGEVQAPKLLWPSLRDYWNSGERVFNSLFEAFTRTYFTSPEYSWSYLVGRALNYAPENILIAAEYGAKVERLSRQFDRIFAHEDSRNLSQIFIFFTGNDLCSNSMNLITSSETFGENLYQGLSYFLRNAEIREEGVHIYLPHFLPITQLLDKESILSHNVGSSEALTCRDFRKNGYASRKEASSLESMYLNIFLPPNFAEKCPTLFDYESLAAGQVSFFASFDATKKEKEISNLRNQYRSTVATLLRNYRVQVDRVVEKMRHWVQARGLESKVHFHILSKTADLDFEGEDLAPDCFHLNQNGQMKIADAILGDLPKNK